MGRVGSSSQFNQLESAGKIAESSSKRLVRATDQRDLFRVLDGNMV